MVSSSSSGFAVGSWSIFSAIVSILLLALPFDRITRRMMKDDGVKITAEMRRQAREINKKLMLPQLRMIAQYFKPGFHPWNFDDEKYLTDWYASIEAAL